MCGVVVVAVVVYVIFVFVVVVVVPVGAGARRTALYGVVVVGFWVFLVSFLLVVAGL